MTNLKHLSNSELLKNTKALVERERELTTEILQHLREVDRRRLFAELGFSSLFDYCVRLLGYSDSAAARRISAMRLISDLPETEEKLKSGRLSLSAANTIQNFFVAERKTNKKTYTPEEKKELVQKIEGKSRRETERVLVQLSPKAASSDRVRPLNEEMTEIQFAADRQLLAKLEKIKNLAGRRMPHASYNSLLHMMADIVLKKLDPAQARKQTGATSPSTTTSPAKSEKCSSIQRRLPSQNLRRAVYLRDGGRCTYKNPRTGEQCREKRNLQLDHIRAYAFGGSTTLENLRLRCPVHNQIEAIHHFGHEKMATYIPSLR